MGYEPDMYVRERSSQMEAMDYIKLTATGPGLFSRKIGDKVKLNITSPEIDSKGKLDSRYQGNYLITALRRVFTTKEQSMALELTKDDYFSDKSNHIWMKGTEKSIGMDSMGGDL